MSEVTTPVTPEPNATPAAAGEANNSQITDSVTPSVPAGEAPAPADEKILGKFKDVEALKNGYTELEKAFHGKAPAEYAFDTVEGEDFKFERNDPMFKEFATVAKAENLSQKQVDAVLNVYKKEILSKTLNAAEEIKKLGPDGQEQVNTVRNWLSNNMSKQSFDAFAPFINSSQFVRAMQELKGKLRQQHVPGQPPGGHQGGGSSQEMRDSWMRNNWDKLKSGDPATKKEFDEIFKD